MNIKKYDSDNQMLSVSITEGCFISIWNKQSISPGFIECGNLFGYSGPCVLSPNQKYTLVLKDAYKVEDDKTGNVELVNGEFLLLELDKLILSGKVNKPINGKVADNGTFILSDWLGLSDREDDEEQASRFFAVNKYGEELINHQYLAGLGLSFITPDGKYAICQTMSSNTDDSQTVSFFDISSKLLVWQIKPVPFNVNSLEIDQNKKTSYFICDGIGKFKYSLDGEFLDYDKWRESRIKHGTGYELFDMADKILLEMGESVMPNFLQDALGLYLLGIQRIDSDYFSSITQRKIGEIYELLGNPVKAIFYYEQALILNKKVGVIRKLKKLKK